MDSLLEIKPLSEFLREVNISYLDFLTAKDGQVLNKCLILKEKSCEINFRERTDFNFVCAPLLT